MRFLLSAAAILIILTLFAILLGKVIKKGNAYPDSDELHIRTGIAELERVANGE